MGKTVLLVLTVSLLCIGGGVWYLSAPVPYDDPQVYFVILDGEAFSAVTQRLKDQRMIRSALWMRLLAQTSGQDTLVQSGSYSVPSGMTTGQLITFFTAGQQLLIKVTIPEGLTITKIATILDDAGVASKEELIALAHDANNTAQYRIPTDSVEGYLFPDTYYFNENHRVEEVVGQMIEGFRANLRANFPELVAADDQEIHRIITLASMIEKEYISADEAPLISSVFQNRLARGQRLEACSTVVYLITEIENKPHPSRLYFSDLQRDSPYNTYRTSGLPPGPIANPGSVAIDAALHPADTDYLYFVLGSADATEHTFSKTFSEHSQARVIYLNSRN